MWYRRNAADINIRELERRWAQDRDEEAGRALQEWRRRTQPIDLEEVAAWLLPRIADIEVYVFAADMYCEECGRAIQRELLTEFRQGNFPGHEHQIPEVACNNQLCNYRSPISQAPVDEDGDFICGADCNWPDVRIDEYSYDTDIFPKGPTHPGYASTPHHCGSGESCLNAFQTDWDLGGEPDRTPMLITEQLDPYGVDYVIQEATDPEASSLARLWGLVYEENYPEIKAALEEGDTESEDLRDNPFDIVPELEALRSKFCAAAQQVYDSWDQNDEGWSESVADGGICHLIAEAIQDVLSEHGIGSTSFSFSIGEVHVTAIADINGAAYMVDIPARIYETGGGYTWRKIPDVVFEPHDINIEPMGEAFEDYLEEY